MGLCQPRRQRGVPVYSVRQRCAQCGGTRVHGGGTGRSISGRSPWYGSGCIPTTESLQWCQQRCQWSQQRSQWSHSGDTEESMETQRSQLWCLIVVSHCGVLVVSFCHFLRIPALNTRLFDTFDSEKKNMKKWCFRGVPNVVSQVWCFREFLTF